MDTETLKHLIETSRLLQAWERPYWLSQLATLEPKQCERLERILTEADALPASVDLTAIIPPHANG